MEVSQIGGYTLTCKFEALLQNFECHITGVYAPNCNIERRKVWWEIGVVRGLVEGPWSVCGDFNVTIFPSEKINCLRRSRAMVEFSDFIDDMNLIDLPLEGDHVPGSLQCGYWEYTKSYFKFDNWWLNTKGFIDRIKEWWTSFEFSGRPNFILACKMKSLKGKLKEWSRSSQGNLGLQKTNMLNQLAMLDSTLEYRALTEEESVKKASLLMEYEEHLKNEEIAWR
nr:uncharacterized protein LOC104102270 [Nicotiana tomentosiformis]